MHARRFSADFYTGSNVVTLGPQKIPCNVITYYSVPGTRIVCQTVPNAATGALQVNVFVDQMYYSSCGSSNKCYFTYSDGTPLVPPRR